MSNTFFNVPLAFFWFMMFLGMITREIWMPKELLAKFDTPRSLMVTVALLLMTFWNLRHYVRAKRKEIPKSQIPDEMRRKIRSITGVDHKVTDPQFNFDDPENEKTVDLKRDC